jgi:exopolysaccharide biosynthesis polyprenyl glycosylphosphotransferase
VEEGIARSGLRSRDAFMRRMLGVFDVLAALAAVVAVIAYAGGAGVRPATLLLAPVVLAVHKIAGLYDRDDLVLRRSTLDEAPVLLQLAAVHALTVAAVGEWLFSIKLGPQQIVLLWGASFVLIMLGRMLARAITRALVPRERCLVLGDADHVDHVARKLAEAHVRADVCAIAQIDGRLGQPERLRELIERHDVHRVVIAPTAKDGGSTVDLVRAAKAAGVRVSILPRVFEAVGSSVEFEEMDGMTMLGLRRFGLSRSSHAVKRAFDVVVGGLCFLLLAPAIAVIALAVRLDSPGPTFFRQTRIGRDGRPFRIWKFRSMVADADALKGRLRDRNEAGDGMFKIADDPRVTRVGRFLRRTSLDELPQIFNVLAGQMSLVGPRPLVTDEDQLVQGVYRSRLHLTPGMTGPWQILGSTRVPMDEMVGIDYLYVANWSLWADVKLLLRTVPHVLARRGV